MNNRAFGAALAFVGHSQDMQNLQGSITSTVRADDYDRFVSRGVDAEDIARMPLALLARQIAELRRDARRQEDGEPDGLGDSMSIARQVREYARYRAAVELAEE